METKHALYIAALTTALGCMKSTVQREPTVPHPISVATDSISRTDSIAYRTLPLQLFHTGNATYEYRTVSVIRVTAGDTIPRTDTTVVTALLSATFQPLSNDNLTIQAGITADSITSRTGLSTALQLPSYADTARINSATGKVTFNTSQSALCDVQTREAVVRLDDVIPVMLRTQTGIWSDTLVRQVCRAGIQLQIRRVIAYQLDSTGAEFRLLRTTTTTFSGRGSQWNQPVESTGQSTSTDTLSLDITGRRRVTRVRGTTQLQLNFKSQLRNQQFEQLTQLFIQLR